MKKLIILLLLVCLTFVACKNDEESQSSSEYSSIEQVQPDSSTNEDSSNSEEPGGNENPDSSYTSLSFSNKNASKVNTTATFDINQYKESAGTKIVPFQIFGEGMCLQRDAINRIWGSVYNNGTVVAHNIAIEFNGGIYYGTVENGKFEIYLPMMNAGGPFTLTFISEVGRKTLNNVYIGEVFLLSGQSNMEFRPQDSKGALSDLYATNECIDSEIRMYRVGWNTPTEPSLDVLNYAQWTGANRSSIASFSAIGYLFGKQMHEELGCPVGLIANPVGGSSIEFWLSEENYNKVQETYTTYTDNSTIMTPCLGYNGMLYPLQGINVRGVVWYQGESNAFGTQEYYDVALKIFMDQCRAMFDNDQLFFSICELARYQGLPYAYSVVNERINEVAKNDPYVVVARNLDQGDWFDIHPVNKREISRRAAYEVLRVFFKMEKPAPVTVSGYTFNQDGTVSIELSTNASLVNDSNGFEVYVNGKYTYNCDATIEGNVITLSAAGAITKVRYGYTAVMSEDVQNDVSKTVTVYDENGFPLDLFIIVDESSIIPGVPDAPSLSTGYCDNGYEITVDKSGDYVINKTANAGQWTAAQLAITDYSSEYDQLTIKFATENVTRFCVQMIVGGITATTGQPYTMYIVLYNATVTDGEHEINIDLNDIPMCDANWNVIAGSSIKNYQIQSLTFSLDTAVETNQLVKEDASCTISNIMFTLGEN